MLSPEAVAINKLIKQSRTDGTQQAIQQRRRKSKEFIIASEVKSSESKADGDKMVTFSAAVPDVVVEMSEEAKAINQRITEFRRARRESKELADSKHAALQQSNERASQVAAAELEAERKELTQNTALITAAGRGLAKAVAAKAGGIFLTGDDWTKLQGQMKELKNTVQHLLEEREASQKLITKVAERLRTTDQSLARDGSPTLWWQKNPDRQAFLRKWLDSDDSGMLMKAVKRNVSPSPLRRSFSKAKNKLRSSFGSDRDASKVQGYIGVAG